jgi:hypothetical protein
LERRTKDEVYFHIAEMKQTIEYSANIIALLHTEVLGGSETGED